jgi:hypothetical protein
MAADYFFMSRDGAVHENLKAALLVKMRSGESGADLLARIKPCPFGEPAHLRKKRARMKNLPYQSPSVVMVGRSICHSR